MLRADATAGRGGRGGRVLAAALEPWFRTLWIVGTADTVTTGLADVALPLFVLTVTGSPLGLGLASAVRSAFVADLLAARE